MQLKRLPYELTVCQVKALSDIAFCGDFYALTKTDEELSLVCETKHVPAKALAREDGWKAFRIEGVLDFSMIGVLSAVSQVLAQGGVSIFALSTYNTDYLLVKRESFQKAAKLLTEN